MPLLVGEIIDEARDRHPDFDRNKNPQKVVRRFLTGYAEELAGKINRIDSTALLIEDSHSLPLLNFDAGIALSANRGVAAVVALDNRVPARRLPVDLIPWAHRGDRQTPLMSAWIVNNKLYLNATAAKWNGVSAIAIAYTPEFTPLTADADVIPLPADARLALVEGAATFMARRSGVPTADFAQARDVAEAELLLNIANALGFQHFRTRDVWP